MATDASVLADPVDRFRLRELLSEWNRALDRSDLPALRRLSGSEPQLSYDGDEVAGRDALAEFVAVHGGSDAVARRTHVNHVQAWRTSTGFRVRAFAMVVHLVGATTPFGDGAPSVAWVGYSDDLIDTREEQWRVVGRRFIRWGGAVLEGFPRWQEVAR